MVTGLLNERAAAKNLGIEPITLRQWRKAGRGPVFVKFGATRQAMVRYRAEDLDAFVREHLRASTSDGGAR